MTHSSAEHNSVVQTDTESSAEPLPILYQDDDLVIVNKPSGLLVHRSPIDRHETRFAMQLVRDQIGRRVYPVHRLDKPTSGALIFALSSTVARQLSEQFAAHQIEKTYLAVVRGFAPESGIIDHPLVEEPDKMMPGRKAPTEAQSALSHYRCLAQAELAVCIEKYPVSRFSLVQVQPQTGRRHQIRRHLKHINHPIIGDAKHGRGRYNRYFKEQLTADRLLLAATKVCFKHPVTGQTLSIQAPLDCCMTQLLQRLGWQAWADHFNQTSSTPS